MAFVKTTIEDPAQEDHEFLHPAGGTGDFVICKGPEKLKRLLECIDKNLHTHYVSDGDWSMHDLIMELLKKYKPAELFITTYALREFSVRQLIMAMDRKELLSVHMLLDYRAQVRTPAVFQLAQMNFNKIYLTSIHAKVTVLRSAACSIAIVGSANWTQNPRVECGVISCDDHVADFHINWIQKIMEHAEIFK
jgi:hypothetical protein